MGSYRQVLIGVGCLAAAFGLGYYLKNKPVNDDLVADSADASGLFSESPSRLLGSEEFVPRESSIETVEKPVSGNLPWLRPSNQQRASKKTLGTELSGSLPPPGQLDEVNHLGSSPPARSSGAPSADRSSLRAASIPNVLSRKTEREIVVPDFSQMAKDFENTPLALPGSPSTDVGDRYRDRGALHRTREMRLKPAAPELRSPQVASQRPDPAEFSTGAAALSDDHLHQSAPPRPDPSLISESELGSGAKDVFSQEPLNEPPVIPAAPWVKPSRETVATEPPSQNVVSMAPDVVLGQTRGRHPFETQAVGKTVPPNSAWDAGSGSAGDVGMDAPFSQVAPGRGSYNQVRRIPFGLTQEAKTELVGLRRPEDRKLKVGATRFVKHVTQPGDTLTRLSEQYYGQPDFYLDIYLANQDRLRNPAEVPAGVTLQIPIYK